MATKNLKVLMSGDTKPYREAVDQAAVATGQMKDDISGHLDSLAGLFGTSMGTIGDSAEKISTVFSGLTAAFSKAAQGGEAFTVANNQLTVASNAVAQAQARVIVANSSLSLAQNSATISAEKLLAAEAEVAAASTALAVAQGAQATAQTAVTAATGLGTIAMNIFKVALISTGIGALVVALGSLVAYFMSTEEGANKIKVALAEVGAVISVLKDRFSSLGEGLYKFFTGDFKGAATAMAGVFSGIGSEMAREASTAGDLAKMTQALNKEERDNMMVQQQRMTQAAQLRNDAKQDGVSAEDKKKMLLQAKQLIIDYYAEEKHIAEGRRDIAMQDSSMHKNMGDELTKVNELKVKVLEVDQESAEAQKALAREMKGVNAALAEQSKVLAQKASDQKIIQDAMDIDAKNTADAKARIQTELANVSKLAYDKEKIKYELEQELNKIELQSVENQTKWTAALAGTTEEMKKQASEIEAINKSARAADVKQAKNLGMDTLMTPKGDQAPSMVLDTKGFDKLDSAAANARLQITALRTEGTKDMKALSSAINSGLDEMAIGIGTFIGNLMLGQGSISSFGDMVAGVFADMAIKIGQLAISTGIAALAIKIGLKSMNPYIMIAAGAALVALGTAVKGSLANIANGGSASNVSSSGGSVYDTTSNTAATKAAQTKVTVTVTGKLTADGKGLATALSNENTRVLLST